MSKKNTAAQAAAKNNEAAVGALDDVALYGSSVQPSFIKIGDADVQLGTVVAAAHQRSGLTVAEWNNQPEADREAAIAATIDAMRATAAIDFSQAEEGVTDAVEGDQPEAVVESAGGAYVVNWHIKTGGVRHEPGAVIDLAEDIAAPFLASGAISAKG